MERFHPSLFWDPLKDTARMKTFSSLRFLLTACSALALTACGGGGGNNTTSTPTAVTPPSPPTGGGAPVSVTLSGTLTYDRVPNSAATGSLNFNATTQSPIRFAPVDLLSGNTVLDSTVSDENGNYAFTLDSGQTVSVRTRSEITRTTGNVIDLQIVDNTSGNAVYALQGAASEMPASDQIRDLNAGSGWGGSSYTGTRSAAPFALLDTVYGAMETLIAVDPEINFPRLDVLWSVRNRPEEGTLADGGILSSSFTLSSNGTPNIRILGSEDVNTDEFDVHVIVHEFGHYFENTFSRSDSIGGSHSIGNRLDARLAFGEGWGNALSGIILEDPVYRDSFGDEQSRGFGFSVERNDIGAEGWFSESSVQSILYDIFDSVDDGADSVSLGLRPIYDAFVSEDYQNSEAFTSIFNFINALESQADVSLEDITPLLTAQNINSSDAFGAGETNDGSLPDQLPIYLPITTNGTAVNFCSVDRFGFFNKHGNRRYLRFDVATARTFNFTMTRTSGPTNGDPDFTVYLRGRPVLNAISGVSDRETASVTLQAGTYVVDARDFRNEIDPEDFDNAGVEACYDFSVQ